MKILWNWIITFTGSNNVSGAWYGFWSGFAGDLTLFAGIIIWYRHHNCHEDKCLRIGHPDSNGKVVCKKHLKTQ